MASNMMMSDPPYPASHDHHVQRLDDYHVQRLDMVDAELNGLNGQRVPEPIAHHGEQQQSEQQQQHLQENIAWFSLVTILWFLLVTCAQGQHIQHGQQEEKSCTELFLRCRIHCLSYITPGYIMLHCFPQQGGQSFPPEDKGQPDPHQQKMEQPLPPQDIELTSRAAARRSNKARSGKKNKSNNSRNQQKILGCKRDHNEQIKKNLPPQLDEPNIPNETGEM